MQVFSLHWMMQNIRLFNVCEARSSVTENINIFMDLEVDLYRITLTFITFHGIFEFIE